MEAKETRKTVAVDTASTLQGGESEATVVLEEVSKETLTEPWFIYGGMRTENMVSLSTTAFAPQGANIGKERRKVKAPEKAPSKEPAPVKQPEKTPEKVPQKAEADLV